MWKQNFRILCNHRCFNGGGPKKLVCEISNSRISSFLIKSIKLKKFVIGSFLNRSFNPFPFSEAESRTCTSSPCMLTKGNNVAWPVEKIIVQQRWRFSMTPSPSLLQWQFILLLSWLLLTFLLLLSCWRSFDKIKICLCVCIIHFKWKLILKHHIDF